MEREGQNLLEFTVKGPVTILLEDSQLDYRSGCSVLDISFPKPTVIGEILFRNYYVAYISLTCKRVPKEVEGNVNTENLPWENCFSRMKLMENPHCEQGSQDIVSLTVKQSKTPWMGIVCLRFILRQPSPQWKKFNIENLIIYKEKPEESKPLVRLPVGFGQKLSGFRNQEMKNSEDPWLGRVASHLQNVWAVAELAKQVETDVSVGRFEVDGSYDISHLLLH